MTSFVSFVTSAGHPDAPPTFAIVYDDEGFEYVWAKDVEPEFDDQDRLELLYPSGVPEDMDADKYISAATYNLGHVNLSEEQDFESRSKAVKHVKEVLKEATREREKSENEDLSGATGLRRASDAWIDSGEDPDVALDEEETLLFMYDALSPIDPEGPNGWLLRIVKGEDPRPGDENGFVVFGANEGMDEQS